MKIPYQTTLKKAAFVAGVSILTAFALSWAARRFKLAANVQNAVATGDPKRLAG